MSALSSINNLFTNIDRTALGYEEFGTRLLNGLREPMDGEAELAHLEEESLNAALNVVFNGSEPKLKKEFLMLVSKMSVLLALDTEPEAEPDEE